MPEAPALVPISALLASGREVEALLEPDDTVAELGAWAVVITLFVCFFIRTETSFHRKYLQPVTALVLVVAAFLPLVAVIMILRPAFRRLTEKEEEEPEKEEPESPPATAVDAKPTQIQLEYRSAASQKSLSAEDSVDQYLDDCNTNTLENTASPEERQTTCCIIGL